MIKAMTDEAIKDTLIHEIAHALTKGHRHDWVWRRKCIELGGDGKATHTSDEKLIDSVELQSKYILTCPCCGNKTRIHRKPKREYSCSICSGGRYNPTYKLELTQNY
jgi:ribosomal protein S27E